MPLQLKTSPPILIFGTVDGAAGEVWLENKSGDSITVSKAVVAVTVGAETDTGTITFADVPINNGAIKRVVFRFGLDVFTPPGTHPATVTLETSAGSLPVTAELIVAKKLDLELAETSTVFTGVTASTTYQGTVIAMNRGNMPVTVGEIPDEPLVEVVTTPRVLTVAPSGDVSVAPAPGLAPAGSATFTNTKPTVEPGDWAVVTFDLTTPAGLPADRYFRVLPRIATRRFVIDLVT